MFEKFFASIESLLRLRSWLSGPREALSLSSVGPSRGRSQRDRVMAAAAVDKSTLVLFDVDGTLTPARKEVSAEMLEFLKELRSKVTVGFVGGSDTGKAGAEDAAHRGELREHIGEDQLKRLINWCWPTSKVDCPAAPSSGCISLWPAARYERDAFEYDKAAQVRPTMVAMKSSRTSPLSSAAESFDVFPGRTALRAAVRGEGLAPSTSSATCFEGGNTSDLHRSAHGRTTAPSTMEHGASSSKGGRRKKTEKAQRWSEKE